MGGFNEEKTLEHFKLPKGCTPMSIMAVGYQADIDVLDDDSKTTELAERIRAPTRLNGKVPVVILHQSLKTNFLLSRHAVPQACFVNHREFHAIALV